MIFVYVENNQGIYKNTAYEIISYARFIANKLNKKITVFSINPKSSSDNLYKFGANKVIEIYIDKKIIFDATVYSKILMKYFTEGYFIFSHSNESIAIAAQISVKKNIPLISNIIDYPISIDPIILKKRIFSGKILMEIELLNSSMILTILPNSIKSIENFVKGEKLEINNIISDKFKFLLKSVKYNSNKISLKDAKIIVSAGKGLQSSKNWSIIENFANKIVAALACSKPVSDLGWRPHSEHVGQTGKIVSPLLYFAIGISGSIQHIAGINSNSIIVVINSDPNAPFFKSADYGIIGDAFKILPKIIEYLDK